MTGFGRASQQWNNKNITIEIRSLNSKSTDIKIRLPQRYREIELKIRKIILNHALRGKIEVNIDCTNPEGGQMYSINKSLFKSYYRELRSLEKELEIPHGDYITGILRIQGVVDVPKDEITDSEWSTIQSVLQTALEQLRGFRVSEGKAMETDFKKRVTNIASLLEDIAPYEQERIDKVRQRVSQHLEENVGKENVDPNRFEQELIYYLEKLDINEEKVRLKQHCNYFIEQIDNGNTQIGRTLTFIGQEMGREINTLGSKAYSSHIQHIVVKMKDELEKIKEQAANIL